MTKLTPHEVRSIAVAAIVDPRSVRRVLAGEAVTYLTRERIRRALIDTGRAHLLPGTTPADSPPPQAA